MVNLSPTPVGRPLSLLVAGTLVGGLISVATAAPATAADVTSDFDTTAPGSLPSGWFVTGAAGDATVQDVPGTVDRSLRLRDTSTTAPVTASTSFGTTSSAVVVGFRLRAAQTSATVGVHLDSSGGHNVTVAMGADGRLYTYNAEKRVDLGAYAAHRWYDIRVVAHPSSATADVYVDGARKAKRLAFRTSTTTLGGIQAGVSTAGTGTAWLDDVRTATESTPRGWPHLGSVAPRTAHQIGASQLIVGAETLDRDYADYPGFSPYLGRLGATGTRLQGGWAKTEKTKNVYDWAWLDRIVEDAHSRGVKPWLQLSYGNGAYTGGGGSGLGGRLPSSPEALEAWDAWVTAMVKRYKNRVTEWEVWNEPNLAGIPVADYTDFFIRTATRIRAEQPNAVVYGQEAGIDVPYARDFLIRLAEKGKAGLLGGFSYHPYNANPDDAWTYGQVEKLRALLAQYAPGAVVRQGENGAPSRPGSFGALGDLDWTELSQSKWFLRRVLNDLGRDISTSVFSISDLHYPSKINSKGLLQTNTDKSIRYAKPSYYAVQTVASVFDSTVKPLPGYQWSATPGASLTVQAFAHRHTGRQIVGVWSGAAKPSESNTRTATDLTFTGGDFRDPVYVDVRTGAVHDIPAANWSMRDGTYTFRDVLVYDSPVLIADRSTVKF
ncbi:GH39 family glycosyl hydrolase [Streptomyces lavendulocolor]|uniref:GH39 family glycosyl hydrolase n=1 Tax=Streptomyces lavendulocolor TaxID=67316 RepID=UPI0033E6E6F8